MNIRERVRGAMRWLGEVSVREWTGKLFGSYEIPRFEKRETSTPASENRAVWGPRTWGTGRQKLFRFVFAERIPWRRPGELMG